MTSKKAMQCCDTFRLSTSTRLLVCSQVSAERTICVVASHKAMRQALDQPSECVFTQASEPAGVAARRAKLSMDLERRLSGHRRLSISTEELKPVKHSQECIDSRRAALRKVSPATMHACCDRFVCLWHVLTPGINQASQAVENCWGKETLLSSVLLTASDGS